ncbi:hypothetical protein M409DRAFT_26855 [Zasmidium cellare ATCC 36951]|uniref:AB hydrolase-1 domain-containing protein n=1 Tax=Zasmidium cellare ATCC 36951 TaxID=1080233 RepID=A0A6A6C6Z9_ZASCE|nr:uncharacterized protein M409DRAFT_26855 [Zasmidium cellare ATCC 36951]KAF2162613.1 hypothetical protein M409DRAFT_26855 [Zasmidium cellare ATCC 36951]
MTDSHDLAVRYEGQGLPVLVIHGWEISGAVEAHDLEPIFDKLDGYRRVYVDLPGMGKTPAHGIKSLDDIFERLSTFVEKHILPSRFLVTGSSCGAYLARAIAYKYADSIDGLLLRVPLVEPENSKRDLDSFTPAIKDEKLLASLGDAEVEKLGDIPVQTSEYVETFKHRLVDKVLPAVAKSDAAVLGSIRNDPTLYRLSVTMHSAEAPFLKPTLILTGRQDSVVGYRDSWPLLKSYPRASFVALDRADHGLPVDKHETDLFRALVTNWLRRVEEVRQLSP